MKIEVITMHGVQNYGSVLQAFATRKILEKHGFEKGSVYIDFMTGNENLDNNYLESAGEDAPVENKEPVNQEGSTAITTDDNPYQTQLGKK